MIGVYKEQFETLPADSTAIVYIKDGWRFVELVQKPGVTLEQEQQQYNVTNVQTIALGTSEGALLSLDRRLTRCEQPHEDGYPGLCQISKVLLFSHNNTLFSLAADGDHATDGELIGMARSLLES